MYQSSTHTLVPKHTALSLLDQPYLTSLILPSILPSLLDCTNPIIRKNNSSNSYPVTLMLSPSQQAQFEKKKIQRFIMDDEEEEEKNGCNRPPTPPTRNDHPDNNNERYRNNNQRLLSLSLPTMPRRQSSIRSLLSIASSLNEESSW
jgi:hypothetical protein